jgi:adenylate cyclase
MMLVIVLNAVALRPLYPALATLGSLAVYLGFVAAAVADPRTQLSRDYAEALMGPSLGIGMMVSNGAAILLVGGGACLVTLLARRLTLDGVRLEKATAQLGRYFSPAVRDKISAASGSFLEPGGEEQVVTVLFCDIRNFTGLSETLPPQAVMALLSDYHSRMVAAVFAHGGTLDKFIGDAVMATFGTPRPAPDDAMRAVRAGMAMRRALAGLNRERAAKGLAEIRHGTGIHLGPAIVGNVGTPERLEYTVIGDTVNVASRIAAACKSTGHDLLISGAVRDRLAGALPLRPVEAVQLPGKAEAVTLFAVDPEGGEAATAGEGMELE